MRCQKSKIFEHPQKSKISGNSETNGFRVIRKKQSFFPMKGQITIFIVLGIVIMIIFGLVFFIRNATSGIVLEKKINKIYGDFLRSTDIKYIVNNCLDKTTKEALLLVGLQGGRIYDYQIGNKGYHIDSFYDVIPFNYTGRNPNGTIYNVSYGIKAVKLQRTGAPPIDPPGYPYYGSLVEDVLKLTIASFFNKPNNQIFAYVPELGRFTILPHLCNKLGPNDPHIFGLGRAGIISCETYSVKNESIQEYIKQYISQNVENCINFTLKETLNYNISTGKMIVNVLMGGDDLLVSLKYPIEISIKGGPPITKYLEFNIRPKVRLKILHEIASHLIGHNPYRPPMGDSNNIFFNIAKDDPYDCRNYTDTTMLGNCIIPGINIFKLPDYCLKNSHCNFSDSHYNYSDILVIEDIKSLIDGRPYRFQFAIENRRPALDFIDESVSPDKYYYWYINATYGKNLTKVYSNVTGNPTSNDYNIIVKSPYGVYIYPLGMDPDEDNLVYNYTIAVSSILTAVHHINEKDVLITTSSEGTQSIIVKVSDNEGLYDYQDVKIRVVR